MTELSPKNYYRSLEPLLDRLTLAQGPNWAELFGRNAPLELEIGFGNGEALHRFSLAEPDRDFVGIEIAWGSIKRALRRLAQPPRANVRLVLLPAQPALGLLFLSQSLDAIRAFFPVPWPREDHDDKRLFSSAFLDLAADRLKSQGLFQLVTDNQILAYWVMEQADSSNLALTLEEKPALLDTKYERKWRAQGQATFFHIQGSPIQGSPKQEAPSPNNHGLKIMRPTFMDQLDPANYHPRGQTGPLTVLFEDFFYDPAQMTGLLLTKIVEERFVQQFYIRIVQLPDGRWKLSPAISGQALPTQGVQLALELAASRV
ncbi:MAG: hypothetical protein LBT86_04300 [Deltaproteobacteria bacterium]|jgi:tRNA (guanine-N7-)-methyltransferase|nr:hypothetical protein [Deltaproteobacteria bacterium]